MELLSVQHISKTYGSGEAAVHALRDVSFSVSKGEFVAVVGESGSGKSTLLNMIGGIDEPSAGKVFIDGKDIFAMRERNLTIFRRRNIGFIFQSFNLIPELTVEQNIIFPVLLDHEKPDVTYLEELLAVLGLRERRHHLPSQLSGGQQQRVAIARAIAYNPEVVLFDEPTSALDPRLTGEVLDVMRKLADEGTTMVVVTHEMDFARKVANWVVYMEDGVIVEEGPSKEFFSQPKSEKTMAFLHMTSSDYVI